MITNITRISFHNIKRRSLSTSHTIGFVGLGHMGGKMAANIAADKNIEIMGYDKDPKVMATALESSSAIKESSLDEIASKCDVVISMLPNDAIVKKISGVLLEKGQNGLTHVSCSTVSPTTSRTLAKEFNSQGKTHVAAPVFARPDGIARREATWMVSGDEAGRSVATTYLESGGRVVDYGSDPGAANIVKLCGNFLIASSIESISEAMALSEKHGVDRKEVMKLLSSTIFDCLIFKGYGQRVSERDHRPGGFSLELGLKDVTLVSETAKEASVPMPFLSTLLDRYTSSKAKGRSTFDWSAIGLAVAEDAGIDISDDLARTKKEIEEMKTY